MIRLGDEGNDKVVDLITRRATDEIIAITHRMREMRLRESRDALQNRYANIWADLAAGRIESLSAELNKIRENEHE